MQHTHPNWRFPSNVKNTKNVAAATAAAAIKTTSKTTTLSSSSSSSSPLSSSPHSSNPFRSMSRVVSMTNLQDAFSLENERPSTSLSTSSWDAPTVITTSSSPFAKSAAITNLSPSSWDVVLKNPTRDLSRTPTPTQESYNASPTANWANILSMRHTNSPTQSLGSESPSPSHSPDSSSRTNTPTIASTLKPQVTGGPFAPQPVRPFVAHAQLIPGREQQPIIMPFASHPNSLTSSSRDSAMISSSNPFMYPSMDEYSKLVIQPISPELIQKQHRRILALVQRQSHWSSDVKKLIFQWTLQHPRTALLLWMADDYLAWERAADLSRPGGVLRDDQIPFSADVLADRVHHAEAVVALQWRVAVKQLVVGGAHTEFAVTETVPLAVAGEMLGGSASSSPAGGASSSTSTNGRYRGGTPRMSKRLDLVSFITTSAETPSQTAVFVRKRLDLSSRPDKDFVLTRLRAYVSLSQHPQSYLSPITCSYARGQTVAHLTPRADATLTEYLDLFGGTRGREAKKVIGWMGEIVQAVAWCHGKGVSIGRGLRTENFLIYYNLDGDDFGASSPASSGSRSNGGGASGHVRLAPFGIAVPTTYRGTGVDPSDPFYVYSAPEVLFPTTASSTFPRRQTSSSLSAAAAAASLKADKAADIWVLGCILLEMCSVVRGSTRDKLAAYISGKTGDLSYALNRERAVQWVNSLLAIHHNNASRPSPPSAPAHSAPTAADADSDEEFLSVRQRRRREAAAAAAAAATTTPSASSSSSATDSQTANQISHVLTAVLGMLADEADERPDMNAVTAWMESGGVMREEATRMGAGVRSDVRGTLERFLGRGREGKGVWEDLESLNGYYAR